MRLIACTFIILCLVIPLQADEGSREKIGEVLGTPVYRDQIEDKEEGALYFELHRLFRAPFEKRYFESHKDELEVKDWEIEYVNKYLIRKDDEQLKESMVTLDEMAAEGRSELQEIEMKLSSNDLSEEERKELEAEKQIVLGGLSVSEGDFLAKCLLSHRKFHRHLYDNFGGGRVIWEQEGLVAFDAMLKWLKFHEEKGDFKIIDQKLHEAFYSYWTEIEKQEDNIFFLDEERIESEFIHPPWIQEQLKKAIEYGAQGRFEEAKKEIKDLLNIDPLYSPAERFLKIIEDVLEKKIENEAAIHLFKGIAYNVKDMFDEAIAEEKEALAISPDFAAPHYILALAYYYKEQYKLATEHCDRAIELGYPIEPKLLEALKLYREN